MVNFVIVGVAFNFCYAECHDALDQLN